ncbi:MAG: FAD-dependent oxidoreductase [Candidatus Izemoplasmataceae bacterium]
MSSVKRFELTLLSKEQVGDEYVVFSFEPNEKIDFSEGQYGLFMHVGKQIEGRQVRAFSIVSSLEEEQIRIATTIGEEPSDFKEKMDELAIGDKMSMEGPMGDFTLETDKDAVFIAGGIGITALRSMIMLMGNIGKHSGHLIHHEESKMYPFKEELIGSKFLTASYTSTEEELRKALKKATDKYKNDVYYYITGAPGFVGRLSGMLEEFNISSVRIKYDRFKGY